MLVCVCVCTSLSLSLSLSLPPSLPPSVLSLSRARVRTRCRGRNTRVRLYARLREQGAHRRAHARGQFGSTELKRAREQVVTVELEHEQLATLLAQLDAAQQQLDALS